MEIESAVVFTELRADGVQAAVQVTPSDRVVFTVADPSGRVLGLVVRFGFDGGPEPMVSWFTGASIREGSPTLAHDLLAGYGWFGREWLFDAMTAELG